MYFNTEIKGTLEIKNKDQAKEIIEEYIDEFINLEKEDGVWGQLVLVFKDHQEVYDIDDPFCDLLEEDNPFAELSKDIGVDAKKLISTIYIHYYNEDDDTRVGCNLSSVFLNCCVEGYKNNNDEHVAFMDENLNKGLSGDPWEITRRIDINKGRQYSEELVKNFNVYMGGERYDLDHFPIKTFVDGWGVCDELVYTPKQIFKLLNKKVKNDYLFYILETGEIVILTALSLNYELSDTNFVNHCKEKGEEYGSQDIFQCEVEYKKWHLFAAYSDMSVINSIKFHKRIPKNEDDQAVISALLRMNFSMIFDCIENYCNEVCGKYKR